ncbi:hypothetical protein ACK32R_20945 [Aeromonas dhakensis]|jgi:hypothetical protein|uniref:hypothetical protein n=1 Tax=Aeromonas dhakensis TaxID=196024 RepID=UPI003986B619
MRPNPEKLHGHVLIDVDGEEIQINGRDFEYVDGGEPVGDGEMTPCIHKGFAKTEAGQEVVIVVFAYDDGDVSDAKVSNDTDPDLEVEILEDDIKVEMVRDPRDHDD